MRRLVDLIQACAATVNLTPYLRGSGLKWNPDRLEPGLKPTIGARVSRALPLADASGPISARA
jgi:hypothetical protein